MSSNAHRGYLGEDGTQEYRVALAKLTALVGNCNATALKLNYGYEYRVQRKVFSKTGKVGLYMRQEHIFPKFSPWKPKVK